MSMKILIKIFLAVWIVILSGCSRDERSEHILSEAEQLSGIQALLAKAPKNIAEREDLPEWLSQFIDNLAPDNTREVAAYKAKWKGEVIFYVSDEYSSCIMCSTFKSNGEIIDWSINDTFDFLNSSTDWECIYLSKSKYNDYHDL